MKFQQWTIEPSAEGIPLVFGDNKYPHDPPRVASVLEAAMAERLDAMREGLERIAVESEALASRGKQVSTSWVAAGARELLDDF